MPDKYDSEPVLSLKFQKIEDGEVKVFEIGSNSYLKAEVAERARNNQFLLPLLFLFCFSPKLIQQYMWTDRQKKTYIWTGPALATKINLLPSTELYLHVLSFQRRFLHGKQHCMAIIYIRLKCCNYSCTRQEKKNAVLCHCIKKYKKWNY